MNISQSQSLLNQISESNLSDVVKTQLHGMHSNLESANGVVDSLIEYKALKTYIICLRDSELLPSYKADIWLSFSKFVNNNVANLALSDNFDL